jgi:hypothetical protein
MDETELQHIIHLLERPSVPALRHTQADSAQAAAQLGVHACRRVGGSLGEQDPKVDRWPGRKRRSEESKDRLSGMCVAAVSFVVCFACRSPQFLGRRLWMPTENPGVLDSVEKGVKLSEAGYGVIEDPVSGETRVAVFPTSLPFRIEVVWGIELTLDSRRKPYSRCLVRGQSPRPSDLAKRKRFNDGSADSLYPLHTVYPITFDARLIHTLRCITMPREPRITPTGHPFPLNPRPHHHHHRRSPSLSPSSFPSRHHHHRRRHHHRPPPRTSFPPVRPHLVALILARHPRRRRHPRRHPRPRRPLPRRHRRRRSSGGSNSLPRRSHVPEDWALSVLYDHQSADPEARVGY